MNPRLTGLATIATAALVGGWWQVQATRAERKIATLEQREAAHIAAAAARRAVDAVMRDNRGTRLPRLRAELDALLPQHPDSDYLRLELARLYLRAEPPDPVGAQTVLEPSWTRIEAGQPSVPEVLGSSLALELGYARLLLGREREAQTAFAAARRLLVRGHPLIDPEIADRSARALHARRHWTGLPQTLEKLRHLLAATPDHPTVWLMIAYTSLDDPADKGQGAREALSHLRDADRRREIERRLAATGA